MQTALRPVRQCKHRAMCQSAPSWGVPRLVLRSRSSCLLFQARCPGRAHYLGPAAEVRLSSLRLRRAAGPFELLVPEGERRVMASW